MGGIDLFVIQTSIEISLTHPLSPWTVRAGTDFGLSKYSDSSGTCAEYAHLEILHTFRGMNVLNSFF